MNIETSDDKISIEVHLSVPRQQAWTFLTGKAHIANWWGDHVTLEARSGGTFLEKWFDGKRQVVTSGKVVCCNPPSELKMTWADGGWPGETAVTFSLSEDGDNTRLVFEHLGWEIHPTGKRESLMDAHASGWSQYLRRLVGYAAEHY